MKLLQIHTRVLPGERIEVPAPGLTVGEEVEVTVVRTGAAGPAEHAIDIIDALPGSRLFKTPQEADEYLKKERDSWDL